MTKPDRARQQVIWTPELFAKQSNKDDSIKLQRLVDAHVGIRLDCRRPDNSLASLAIEYALGQPEITFPGTERLAVPWQLTRVWSVVPDLSKLLTLPVVYIACVPPPDHKFASPDRGGPRPYADLLFRGELKVHVPSEPSEIPEPLSVGIFEGMVVTERSGRTRRIWDAS